MHLLRRGAFLKGLVLIAAGLLTVSPLAVQALGVGKFTVLSGLDEPLNGQIELIAPSALELKTLKASLASRADFEIAGVERAGYLFDMKYTLTKGADGKNYLKVTTDNPVREPFLHFLVQVEWNGGKIIREYSALLDPPQWATGAPTAISTPEVGPGETLIVPQKPPAASAVQTSPTAESQPAVAAEAPVVAETPAPVEELPPLGTGLEPSEAVEAEKTQIAGSESAPAAPAPEPATAASEPVVETPPVAAATEPTVPAPAAAPAPIETVATTPESEVAHAPAPVMPSSSEYGPVQKGETLSQIATKVVSDKDLSPQQIMIAMLRANPSAFFGDNVNNLKTGKILKIPERREIETLSRDQAVREYRAQYDAWQEYKLKLAGTSRMVAVAEAEKPAVEEKAPVPAKEEKSAKSSVKAKQKPASGKAEPVDLLKIVRANLEDQTADETTKTPGVETKKDATKEHGKLNERVATLEEAIESKQLQNKEMRERVGKLQEQVKNTERLIELENKDLALAQKQATEKQEAEAAEKAAQEKAAQEKAAQEKAAQEKAAAEAKPQEAKPPVVAGAKVPPKKPAVAPTPAAEDGFLDTMLSSVMDNPLALGLLGAVGVLALGMGGLYAYRRRRASREFSESILSGSSLTSEVSMTDTSGQAAPSDTSFLSDFSQGGMGNIHTDEVDPIAEAEVYLAYGRDEQAEEILKDAIVKDPVRQELKGKLLEIYFQRNDVAAFETLAEELYAQLEGKGGKVWDKAEEMGRKLSPNNPMFRGGKPAGGASSAAATTMLVGGMETAGGGGMDTGLQFETQEMESATGSGSDSGSIDFNLNFDSTEAAPSESGAMDLSFDMSAEKPESTDFDATSSNLGMDFNVAEPETTGESPGLVDFSLEGSDETTQTESGIDFTPASETPATESIDFSTGGLDTLSVEMEGPETSGTGVDLAEASLPGWDETATKLDLAKAYIDMGDSEGARSILEEVIAEGNDEQKQQARELSSQIAA